MKRTVNYAFKKLGISEYNNHDRRATYATQLKGSGCFSAIVADLMGYAMQQGLPFTTKKPKLLTFQGVSALVGLVGLEPMTSTMSTWRSNQLSYNPERLSIITHGRKNVNCFFQDVSRIGPGIRGMISASFRIRFSGK